MAKTEKRQFVTFPVVKGRDTSYSHEVTIAVDTIKDIVDVMPDVPVYQSGARAFVNLKKSFVEDGRGYYTATLSRAEIEAKLDAPAQKPALVRLRLKSGKRGEPFTWDWFDIVAIGTEPDNEYLLRTPFGLAFYPYRDVRRALEGDDNNHRDYEEV